MTDPALDLLSCDRCASVHRRDDPELARCVYAACKFRTTAPRHMVACHFALEAKYPALIEMGP